MQWLADVVVRAPRRVIAAWALVAILGMGLAAVSAERLGNSGYEVPGSQSALAGGIQQHHGMAGTLVYVTVTTRVPSLTALRREVGRVIPELGHTSHTATVYTPDYGEDGRAVVLPVLVRYDLTDAQKHVEALSTSLRKGASPGMNLQILGEAAVFHRYSTIGKSDLEKTERLSFPVPLILLLFAFLSPLAALLPVVSAGVALTLTLGVIGALAEIAQVSIFATNTAVALVIGLSIDFALFMVMRFREFRAGSESISTADAVRSTITTTGRAVVLSGMTIASALTALLLVGVGFFSSIAAGGILAALAASATGVTLVPALLLVFGGSLDRMSVRGAAKAADRARIWHWLGRWVVSHAWLAATGAVIVLLALAAPIRHMGVFFPTTSALPASDSLRLQSDRVTASIGPGVLTPIFVATNGDGEKITKQMNSDTGIAFVLPSLELQDGWQIVPAVARDNSDSQAAEATVRRLRRELDQGQRGGTQAYVGGVTAQSMDLAERVSERTPLVVVVALLLAGTALAIGFRSVVVPIKAMLTTALSVAAGLGVTTLIFQGAGDQRALVFLVPLLLFAIILGLSTDYEIFLLSRIKEGYADTGSNAASIEYGLVKSGRSITVAGAIMIVVFLIFAASSLVQFQELGVGTAIAVLLDVTVVRVLLVPAVVALCGDLNWWPARRLRSGMGAIEPKPAEQTPE